MEIAGLRQSVLVPLNDASQVGEARRIAVSLARSSGLTETEQGKAAIVATEMATNILKHAGAGELILRCLPQSSGGGIELLSVDRGPGSGDARRWLVDGYSTAGSAGQGLGAIHRQSNVFDLFSEATLGTVVLSQVWSSKRGQSVTAGELDLGVICVPYRGEARCGDGWTIEEAASRLRVILADGLGHGTLAAEAADEAIRTSHQYPEASALRAMELIHGALRKTRGAAVAVVDLDRERQRVGFVGVGNIAGYLLSPTDRKGLASGNGIVGHEIRKFHEYELSWPTGGTLVLHSDGITSRWRVDQGAYLGLMAHHPAVIAATIYRDFSRGRDDATVLVLKEKSMGGMTSGQAA